jgi:hypothetical protein
VAAQPEGALDHRTRAVADEMREIRVSDRRKAVDSDRVVEARDEIGCGIDERAVEVEDDCWDGQDELQYGYGIDPKTGIGFWKTRCVDSKQ